MSTEYSLLYPLVRNILGDVGIYDNSATPIKVYDYSEETINGIFDVVIGFQQKYKKATVTSITPDITDSDNRLIKDGQLMVLRVCESLLQPQVGAFSYQTSVLSIKRGGSGGGRDKKSLLLESIRSQIAEIENEGIPYCEGVAKTWFEQPERWQEALETSN